MNEPKIEKVQLLRQSIEMYRTRIERLNASAYNLGQRLVQTDSEKLRAEKSAIEAQAVAAEQKLKAMIALAFESTRWLEARGIAVPALDPLRRKAARPQKLTDDELQQLESELELLRETIAERKFERRQIDNALPPAELLIREKEKQIDQALEQLASPGHVIARNGSPADVCLLVLALFGPELKEKLRAHILKTDHGGLTLSPADKIDRLARVDQNILALEQNEETIVLRLEAAGVEVMRRGDLNCIVFLECEEIDPTPRAKKVA